MKKVFLALVLSILFMVSYAQDANYDLYKGIDSKKMLNLSAEQIAKIKKLNSDVGPKFAAIGQSNLSGYEKGRKKKALALEHKAAIRQILSEAQIRVWENYYGNMNQDEGLRDIIKDDYDIRLELLEKKYERDKEMIEDSALGKEVKKDELKTLKKVYKNEKKRLKDERDASLKSGVLS